MKPEILCHPNIPKPLHGVAPRVIMGDAWWNIERQNVYKSNNYHCVACGVHKNHAKAHRWLEAHEFWVVDYQTGICKIPSIEPLCHYCHNFIHSGRLTAICGKDKTENQVRNILEHGFKILSTNNLKCFYVTLDLAKQLKCNTFSVESYKVTENPNLKWTDYKLIWNGNEYKSNFNNIEEWALFYDVVL